MPKRTGVTKEAYEKLKEAKFHDIFQDGDTRIRIIERINKLDLGQKDWLVVRIPRNYDPEVSRSIGKIVKTEWPEWEGHVLYLNEEVGLEVLHWLARVSLEDVNKVLEAMEKHYE